MPEIKTPSDFQDQILSADVALLDFWAPWCGPCRMMMPNLEALQVNNPNLVIGKVNVDENKALAQTFGIRSIPTLILVRKGEVKGTLVGAQSLERLQQFVYG
ncbi:hypothetical protein WJ96_06455 [Burkholderia ubonensis]|uniref:Thioredoxin n=1 Tax=Burkholderia ubonensis TaxID=101571 RepID=A0AAW3MRJ4_9BURK|nr:thioredoxin [Burkholderia ubonensis]KVP98209.1 hypothetical protein WJ96_06455 [Burkholderia ubonensis]KVZ92906.1 hypothetical protein WL25_18115 [Burkholderia ubonensis]